MDLNHFVISGNLTRDPELRQLSGGTLAITYTVACNFVRYDENNVKHERTDFVPITTFGRQADRDSKYLQKGSAVTVEGRIESWYQKDKKRGGFNFKATNVQYGGRIADYGEGREEQARDSGGSEQERDEWTESYDATEESLSGPRR